MSLEDELQLLSEFRAAVEDRTMKAAQWRKRASFLMGRFRTPGIDMRLASAIDLPEHRSADLDVVEDVIRRHWARPC